MYGQVTPPTGADIELFEDWQCPGGSGSTNATFFMNDWSPDSIFTVATNATTPPRSPPKIRESGPLLLPRVRDQDQLLEPVLNHAQSRFQHGHSRATSLPVGGIPLRFGGYLPAEPAIQQRSISPPGADAVHTPVSVSTLPESMVFNDYGAARPSIANNRSISASNLQTHSRNTSSGSIDASVLRRHGYPTYRHSPGPQPATLAVPMSRTPSAMSFLAPITMPGGHMQTYPNRRRTQSPPVLQSRLSVEVESGPALDQPYTTMLDYLTAPNPSPSLTQRTVEGRRGQNMYFWFDIRNIRPWADFNLDTITSIDPFSQLLAGQGSARQLPAPGRINLNPETPAQLTELCANHYALKVNAALKFPNLESGMAIRTLRSVNGGRQQPEFVASRQNDVEKTIYGDGRGRVVGITKCFDQWNSGMRSEAPPRQVTYLQSLAQLHYHMREHGCRYGFIITEIELVCVRMGGRPHDNSKVPFFGFLELSQPIQLATCGRDKYGNNQMTACLALWWLHILASTDIQGQYGWAVEIGAPGALTRRNHLDRDDWMPKANTNEKREAKRLRGWVWPEEPWSKRESGRSRRVKS